MNELIFVAKKEKGAPEKEKNGNVRRWEFPVFRSPNSLFSPFTTTLCEVRLVAVLLFDYEFVCTEFTSVEVYLTIFDT
jgi:hypothetical protein